MPIRNMAIGRPEEATYPDTLKAALAEFISTLIFVFAGSGSRSRIAFNKLNNSGPSTPAGLISASIAHAFALFVAVSVGSNISGRHVNPASPSALRRRQHHLLAWHRPLDRSASRFRCCQCASLVRYRLVLTFGLVYTVYATAIDPKKGNLGIIATIAIGFIVGANILVGGACTGASMNPAVSFGLAVVSWSWDNHWVYWVGPPLVVGFLGLYTRCSSSATPANNSSPPLTTRKWLLPVNFFSSSLLR